MAYNPRQQRTQRGSRQTGGPGGPGGSRGSRGPRPQVEQEEGSELQERVVRIDRTRKTVKGGRISSSRVLVAVGDGKGNVGLGVGKARNAPEAIAKALNRARKTMIRVPMDGYTITHEVTAKVGGAVILLKPASRGTGIIAGGATRQIIEVSGIRDILTKSLGSGNVFNRAKACFKALTLLRTPREVAEARGFSVMDMLGRAVEDPYATEEPEEATPRAVAPRYDDTLDDEADEDE
ncbi:MAG: 30S ribosomal protein S5 [Armatimonadetes bacterium]|nr:30S ribosomal protein S5 [Armatimonadota bacterium]